MNTSIEHLYEIYRQHPAVSIDSRHLPKGCLFFALRGERFDGNAFAARALAEGASYAVIDNPDFKTDERCLLVEDTLKALQMLALHHRRLFDIPVVAITGSNGKTTTKELVSGVLAAQYRTHFTKGNLNNHIGVPLTLLAMPADTEIAVVEMGANHQGEIDFLCRIAEPAHGLITNIGKAHLEGFGGFEGVKKGKSELYRYLAETGGVVFVNRDEPFLEALAESCTKKIFYHASQNPNPNLLPYETQLLENQPFLKVGFLSENGNLVEAQSNLYGVYNFNNLQTAIAVGRYFKVPAEKIAVAIEAYIPSNNRSQLQKIGANTFLMDAYNANPTSMRHALENFADMTVSEKIAIIGAMRELGDESENEHFAIAELAKRLAFGTVILVGKEFESSAEKFGFQYFDSVENLKEWFDNQAFTNVHFLIKGSRGVQLEKLVGAEAH